MITAEQLSTMKLPRLDMPLPGPEAKRILTADHKLLSPSYTRDYPLVQGVVLITASTYVLVNLLVDVSYSLLNPRIRVKGSAGES